MANYDAEMSSTAATATTNSISNALVPYNDQSAGDQAEERKELMYQIQQRQVQIGKLQTTKPVRSLRTQGG